MGKSKQRQRMKKVRREEGDGEGKTINWGAKVYKTSKLESA
jgi:hypothetical protein